MNKFFAVLVFAAISTASAQRLFQTIEPRNDPEPSSSSSGGQDFQAQALVNDFHLDPNGPYEWNFETSNGIKFRQKSDDGINAEGQFSFTHPEGDLADVKYKADENGFQPSNLPIGPAPDPHIFDLLEKLKQSPESNQDILNAEIARYRALAG